MKEPQPLDSDWLWQQLQRYYPFNRIIVALSGGVDSTVLLHLLHQLRQQHTLSLTALHINHRLQPEAASWADHCATLCGQWQIPLQIETVAVEQSGQGLESDARAARYQLFESVLEGGDILVQGHHSDDQAETVIMRLMRGSGIHGLAAIPAQRAIGHGRVVRPLLEVARQQIVDYACHHQLAWIEDPSNTHLNFERNLIRHEILPRMESHRSGVKKALVRSAGQFCESAQLLDQLAQLDLAGILVAPRQLDCEALGRVERGRCRNLLRYWIASNRFLPPSSAVIDRIIDEGLHARADARPLVGWQGGEVRRYRNRLYLLERVATDLCHTPVKWDGENELELAGGLGVLRATHGMGTGMRADLLAGSELTVRWRAGGERIQPQGRAEHHTLKNLFQEAAIPPWQRKRYPLIYLGERLAYIPNLYPAAEFAPKKGEAGVIFEWTPH